MKNFELFTLAILIFHSNGFCQVNNQVKNLGDVLNPSRLEMVTYKLAMYNQAKDLISNPAIVSRAITKETRNQISCFKITEINTVNKSVIRTISYVDQKTLLPVYFEIDSSDVVVKKAIFDKTTISLFDIKKGIGNSTEMQYTNDAFLSNSFSELLQSNDFKKNKAVKFKTFTPGMGESQFTAERIGEQIFILPNQGQVKCWTVKFTRRTAASVESPVGFRYIDKISGKVLMYKTTLDSDSYFSYQVLSLN